MRAARCGHRDLVRQGCRSQPQYPEDERCIWRDLEQTRASIGTLGGRLHEFVNDAFSMWPLDTAEYDGSNNTFAPEVTYTKGGSHCTGESDFEPSASQPLGDSTTRRHSVGTLRHGQDGQDGR